MMGKSALRPTLSKLGLDIVATQMSSQTTLWAGLSCS